MIARPERNAPHQGHDPRLQRQQNHRAQPHRSRRAHARRHRHCRAQAPARRAAAEPDGRAHARAGRGLRRVLGTDFPGAARAALLSAQRLHRRRLGPRVRRGRGRARVQAGARRAAHQERPRQRAPG